MKKKNHVRHMENSRRRKILDVAAALFRENGFEATTIRDITNAVGIASGSTFCHFSSKREILDAVAIEGIQQILKGGKALARQDQSPEDQFRFLVGQHINFLHHPPCRDFVAVLLYESRSLSDAARAEVIALMESYEAIWKTCLRRLAPDNAPPIDGSMLHSLLFGALNWTVHWYSPDNMHSPEALAEQIAGLILPAMKNGAGANIAEPNPGHSA